jgi:hypothetical protein
VETPFIIANNVHFITPKCICQASFYRGRRKIAESAEWERHIKFLRGILRDRMEKAPPLSEM